MTDIKAGDRVRVRPLDDHWSKTVAPLLAGLLGTALEVRPEQTSDNSGQIRAMVEFDQPVTVGLFRYTGFWFLPDELELLQKGAGDGQDSTATRDSDRV